MPRIYLAMSRYDYEAPCIMRAYAERKLAERFAAQCTAHKRKEPQCPQIDAPDEEWSAYTKARASPILRAPRGFENGSYFTVMPIPFVPPKKPRIVSLEIRQHSSKGGGSST